MPGPHPTDESANSLPDPELNPLLNPVLAAHMGRWAEVYFTAPPEKREEAVWELLRDLRNDSPAESPSIPSGASGHGIEAAKNEEISETPALEEAPQTSSITATEPALICGVCAYQNAARQLFCGMCGSRLQIQPETVSPEVVEAAQTSIAQESEPEPSPIAGFQDYVYEPKLSAAAPTVGHDVINPGANEPAAVESVWTLPQRSLPHFGMEPEPETVPYRYRVYIGAVLAILLVLLLYMAWRGTQAMSGIAGTHSTVARTIPPAPPAAVPAPAPEQPPVPATAPSSAPASSSPAASAEPSAMAKTSSENAHPQPSPARPSASRTASPKTARPATPVRSEKHLAAAARKSQPTATRRKTPAMTMAASSSPLVADTGGAEELASAERYLNGTPRDSREAAQLLWKAMGKGNLAATIALSDLYLRGDGVPKSCDQARLLLDAAARKGGRAAAERLRNLQAFGCN